MPWSSSDRRTRLPKNWPSLRANILRRDNYRCQISLDGCSGIATEVDHIARGDNHSPENLRAACSRCHKQKTQAEALEARRKKRAARFRPIERHPGAR